ncbi:MAG: CocE/NonD family hydrolase [Polyangiaceae bacterium]
MQHFDAHWLESAPVRSLARDTGVRRSLYLRALDGTPLAIDVTLPSSYRHGDKLGTILRQTRYFRSVELLAGLDFEAARDAFDLVAPTRERFLAAGYAWVDVDVRGSGVSGGAWPVAWSTREVADGATVVDFITSQPWSNGCVGSLGISYEGTTAEMLLVNQRDAVKAIVPRFSLFCAYEDIAFPGGTKLTWFTEGWSRFNRLLDAHRFHEAMASLIVIIARARASEQDLAGRALGRLLDAAGDRLAGASIGAALGVAFRGGRRVDGDATGALRTRALLDHAQNGDIHTLCRTGAFRDEFEGEVSFFDSSPRGHTATLRASGAAVLSQGGWFDGAYGQAAVRRLVELGRGRVLLGPWGHAGVLAHAPYRGARPAGFPHDLELLRFFDLHLRGRDDGASNEPKVRYFTLGEGWRSGDCWPPHQTRSERLHLRASGELSPEEERGSLEAPLTLDPNVGVGERSRWRGVLAAFVAADYVGFTSRMRGSLTFDARPASRRAVITGHATLRLQLRAGTDDLALHAYLSTVRPSGEVAVMTEGHLRARCRREQHGVEAFESLGPTHSLCRTDELPIAIGERIEMAITFLPISFVLERGDRLRLSLALADRDHFEHVGRAGSISHVLGGNGLGAQSFLEVPFEGES